MCHHRHALRLPHAMPPQPGDPSLGASAASGPTSISAGLAETNGVPAASLSSLSSADSSSRNASGGSSDGGTFPVEHSARASFRSVLK
jgi:hypothetical protein